MNIECVVVCYNASGSPDFYSCIVNCSEFQYKLGKHYDLAETSAKNEDYNGPFVIFDRFECPDWLFERFDWKSATVVGNTNK